MNEPKSWKEWERDLIELDQKLAQLKERLAVATPEEQAKHHESIAQAEARRDRYIEHTYKKLTNWKKVLVARADPRPYTLDYIKTLFTDFVELQGDRRFGTDNAIIGGPADYKGQPVMIVGHQKGRNIQERQQRNFAMAKPEGYRKAIRLFEMADRFSMPIITFIDTPAADPGVESESRGISEAIAASILSMFALKVPVVSVVIGEGGSGGAIGIGIGNKVLMQEHAIYSVIPPEGCAAILWRDAALGPQASHALRLTAQDALTFGLVDEIIAEPKGAAHRSPTEAAALVEKAIDAAMDSLKGLSGEELKQQRHKKFRAMGQFGGAVSSSLF
ncbi:MAG: acetyl-CoA carboxylase carboxyltransferase subunit alpha [Chthonomonas sp.]|nr:acetyl-CoA carboxylase carboxyltransferase subunit alpha [Chthonomonas sp.]